MSLIAKQLYVKTVREVSSIEQVNVEYKRHLHLYDDKITTEHREFSLKDILDISYKQVGSSGGLLFLHTDHSVYSYHVKDSPQLFIDACKKQLGKK